MVGEDIFMIINKGECVLHYSKLRNKLIWVKSRTKSNIFTICPLKLMFIYEIVVLPGES